jgi:hypothetical protein
MGIWNRGGWEGVEEGEVSLRVTCDQGGRDPITARRVSKQVKGNRKGSKGESARGSKIARGLRRVYRKPVYVYIIMSNVECR